MHKAKFKNTFDHSLYGVIKRSNYTLTTRLYSSKADKDINIFNNQTYFMKFSDADEGKRAILEKSQGKTGIYMWTNKLNGKKYVGSSINLKRRFLEYYNVNRLLKENSMPINNALLKYGYQNFSLTILEFCEAKDLIIREKYYFEAYSPEYNILKTPGNPSRGQGWKHSEATIENMRIAALKRLKSPEYINKLSASQSKSIQIEVTNLEKNTTRRYNAIRAAARALAIDKRYLEHYIYLKQKEPVLGKYTFKLVTAKTENLNLGCTRALPVYIKNQKTSKKLEVINVNTNESTIYTSIGAAARELNLRQPAISLYLKQNRSKPFKGLYWFKLV